MSERHPLTTHDIREMLENGQESIWSGAEFDAWLAQHDREVREDTLNMVSVRFERELIIDRVDAAAQDVIDELREAMARDDANWRAIRDGND